MGCGPLSGLLGHSSRLSFTSGLLLLMFSTEPDPYFWIQAAAWSFIFSFYCIAIEHLARVNKCDINLASSFLLLLPFLVRINNTIQTLGSCFHTCTL